MRIVFFTGAGISRESGLQTFRDEGGLWQGQPVDEVCSIAAWRMHPERVLDFYNERRRGVIKAAPNAAHDAIAALENTEHTVHIVTQNIDDLHERAGSKNVIHLHGEIMKARSVLDEKTFYDCLSDIELGDTSPNGEQLRPHVVFFGESIYNYDAARSVCKRADVMIVVGTSLAVYPAAYFVEGSNARQLFIIDPNVPNLSRLHEMPRRVQHIRKSATDGVPEVIAKLTTANL